MPSEKTVRVRILVAVDSSGQWVAQGADGDTDSQTREYIFIDHLQDGERYSWVEADVPLPADGAIEGSVSDAE